jgi:hypothetical protein
VAERMKVIIQEGYVESPDEADDAEEAEKLG